MKSFLNDNDGISQRDFLLLISSGVFFLFVSIGLILLLLDRQINPMYLELLGSVSPVVMTIVGGVFGVQITQEIRKPRQTSENYPNVDEIYQQIEQLDSNDYDERV